MAEELSYKKLLESLFDGVYYVDWSKRIAYWNKAAERITGYSRLEVLGISCSDNLLRHVDGEGRELCTDGCPMSATLLDGKMREAKVYLHHKQGHRVPVSIRVSPVRDAEGTIVGAVEIFVDNSNFEQILKDLERLREEAYVDELTRVGNRRYGMMTLHTRLYELREFKAPFGVLFLDIDQLKVINDVYGHKTGDQVLGMAGKTIANVLRRGDSIARWGGDEFVVVLGQVSDEILRSIAERMRVLIERSFIMVGSEKLSVTASLGATLARREDSVETVLERADALMYVGKTSGGNRVSFG